MSRYTGIELVVRWIYSGGTVNLTGDRRTFTTSESVDDADATAGTVTYRDHLPTFVDATATLEMLDNTATGATGGTAIWAALAPRTSGTVEWSPQGTASGEPKWTAPAYVQTRDRDIPYDDVVSISIDWQLTAEPTLAAWSA